jgi:holo-[acyl-carrier protein] synthase
VQPVIVGVGVDALEVSRMRRELLRGDPGFCAGLFTRDEIDACSARRFPARHFAAHFAAKEALLKALGAERLDTGVYREAEVRHSRSGVPRMVLRARLRRLARRRGADRVLLSLTAAREVAVAMVVLESASIPPTPTRGRCA